MDLENNQDIDLKNLDNLTKNSFNKFEETCRALQTAKLITEKKNLLSEITEFLNDSKIVRILDCITNGKETIPYDKENVPQYSQYSNSQRSMKSFSLNWTTLFNLIQNFVINELNLLKDKNPSMTQSQRSGSTPNVDNKVYQLRACLNLLLNQINSRGCNNLQLDNFLNLFDSVLQLSEDYSSFQIKILNDLSNFMSNYILNNSKYCSEIKKQNWIDLINFYMSNYLNYLSSSLSVDPVYSLKCLRRILSNVIENIGCINSTKIFSFLSTGIMCIKKDTNPELIENMIGCAYELCYNFQFDCLFEVLKFGEENGMKIIEIFDSKNTTPVIKDLILKFFMLQIDLHKHVEHTDLELNPFWTELIRSIYQTMIEELKNNCLLKLSSIK
ncbi:unnamed protein product [Brachionus calyciflorus]|uniref:Uncharacterized protein n=1 Tax=Brachionus calyciflorus TaxID=104777 RepID=A0A813YCW2_9BILA|nr:unnamed protein product [Brachionus calyciflorus]